MPGKPNILVVEDNTAVLMLYEDYFSRSEIKALYAKTSGQAIEVLEASSSVRLVLLDKDLADGPGKGQTVLDYLNARKDSDTDFPIVLTVSANDYFEKGVYESLTKPGMRLAMKEYADPREFVEKYLALAAAERKGPARLWIGGGAIRPKNDGPHF